jgi:hypothetical protein
MDVLSVSCTQVADTSSGNAAIREQGSLLQLREVEGLGLLQGKQVVLAPQAATVAGEFAA